MADYKITELNELTAVAPGDLLVVVDDPSGTPVTKKITVANLFDYMAGMIVMWSGSIASIPAGWALCDGNNGTPNLRDRFVVGAGSTYAVADTGGAATHTLTENEIPAHAHIQQTLGTTTGAVAGFTRDTSMSGSVVAVGVNTANAGGGAAHNNLPPYYALAFIMKL